MRTELNQALRRPRFQLKVCKHRFHYEGKLTAYLNGLEQVIANAMA